MLVTSALWGNSLVHLIKIKLAGPGRPQRLIRVGLWWLGAATLVVTLLKAVQAVAVAQVEAQLTHGEVPA